MMNRDNSFYVYALVDPRNNKPFYIGKGKGKRAFDHLKESKETTQNIRKYYKIQSIISQGFEIQISFLYKNLSEETAYYMEEFLIWKYGRKDFDENGILTNICESAKPPSWKGKKHTPEHIEKLRELKKGNKQALGYKHTAEAKEKIRNAHTGMKASEETKKKLVESHLGQKAWNKGIPNRAEAIEKNRQAHIGKKASEETRRKMAEKQKERWALIKAAK